MSLRSLLTFTSFYPFYLTVYISPSSTFCAAVADLLRFPSLTTAIFDLASTFPILFYFTICLVHIIETAASI